MPLSQQERGNMVAQLTTNCECWKGQEDAALLNSFTDEKLQMLVKKLDHDQRMVAVANAAVAGVTVKDGPNIRINPETLKWEAMRNKAGEQQSAPQTQTGNQGTGNGQSQQIPEVGHTNNSPKKPMTTADWLRLAPPEAQESFQAAQAVEQREKDRLIGILLANVNPGERAAHAERLNSRSVADLTNDVAIMPKVNHDDTTPKPQARRQPLQIRTDEDILELPVINYADDGQQGNQDDHGDRTVQPSTVINGFESMDDEAIIRQLPRHLAQRLMTAEQIEAREKRSIVDKLTANIRNEEQQMRAAQRFMNMSLAALQDILPTANTAVRTNYFGAQAAPPVNNKSAPVAQDSDDILLPPVMNFNT